MLARDDSLVTEVKSVLVIAGFSTYVPPVFEGLLLCPSNTHVPP